MPPTPKERPGDKMRLAQPSSVPTLPSALSSTDVAHNQDSLDARAAASQAVGAAPMLPAETNYDDDEEDAILTTAPKERWLSQLFGVGQRGWSVLLHEIRIGCVALFLLIVAGILKPTCKERCDFIGAHVSTWFGLAAYSVAVSIPGRLIDKLFFASFHFLGEVITLPFLNPLFFYVGAFEGAIARFFWIGLTWTNWDTFVTPSQPILVEDAAEALFVFQVLAVLRNLALRLLLRNVLIGSFENAINDGLFQNLVLLGLSKPKRGPGGRGDVCIVRDTAYKELLRMHSITDFKRKLDFISKMRFRMYTRDNELVAITKKEYVAAFAKWTYKQLATIPEEKLVQIDIKSSEVITDKLLVASRQRGASINPNVTIAVPETARRALSRELQNNAAAGSGLQHIKTTALSPDDGAGFFIGQTPEDVTAGEAESKSSLDPFAAMKSGAAAALSNFAGVKRMVSNARRNTQTPHLGPTAPPHRPSPLAKQNSSSSSHGHSASAMPALSSTTNTQTRTSRALTAMTFVPPNSPMEQLPSPAVDPYAATGAVHTTRSLETTEEQPAQEEARDAAIATQPSARTRPSSAPKLRAQSSFFQASDVAASSTTGAKPASSAAASQDVEAGAMSKLAAARRPSDPTLSIRAPTTDDGSGSTMRHNWSGVNLKSIGGMEHTINTLTHNVGKYLSEAIRKNLHVYPSDHNLLDSNAAPNKAKPKKVYQKLRLAHFATCLDSQDIDPEKALALFDTNGDNFVEMNEFIEATISMWSHLRELKASLNGQQSVSTAINWLLDAVFWLLFMIAALWIYDVPVVQVFVPLGTVLVSASFAIGNSLSNVVSSLIFVLITKPYNVGDRVTCSGVFNGEETLIVRRIDVLTTTFIRLVNKEIIVPNHQLLQQNIENFKRSPPAVFRVDLLVSYLTTAAQLEALRQRLNAFLESEPLSWKPTSVIRMTAMREQSLVLSIWLQSFLMWQDAPRLFKAIFNMYMHLIAAMRELGIAFKAPEQSLKIEGSITTHVMQQQQQQQQGHAAAKSSDATPMIPGVEL